MSEVPRIMIGPANQHLLHKHVLLVILRLTEIFKNVFKILIVQIPG